MLTFADAQPAMSEYLYCLNDRRDARLIAAFMTEASIVYPWAHPAKIRMRSSANFQLTSQRLLER